MGFLDKITTLIEKQVETTNDSVSNHESVEHFFGDVELFVEFVMVIAGGKSFGVVSTPNDISGVLLSVARVAYEKGVSDSASKS